MGVCNLFFFIKNKNGEQELVTPVLDGTILPGVLRDSTLRIALEMNRFKVNERKIYIDEIIEAHNEGRVFISTYCEAAGGVWHWDGCEHPANIRAGLPGEDLRLEDQRREISRRSDIRDFQSNTGNIGNPKSIYF
jgi:hypothetical protein